MVTVTSLASPLFSGDLIRFWLELLLGKKEPDI